MISFTLLTMILSSCSQINFEEIEVLLLVITLRLFITNPVYMNMWEKRAK